jgi:4-diphosphocytidyl-2-C-methyl-D-erythritol kinase
MGGRPAELNSKTAVPVPPPNSVYSRAPPVKPLEPVHPLPPVTVFSPAKINLFLAVTGRRPDGYHDLLSVAAPLDFGDELTAEVRRPGPGADGQFSLVCDDPAVPAGGDNLVLRAAAAFAAATRWTAPVTFRLTKRIPLGAGLGGGSSNAVAALRALSRLSGAGLGTDALAALAAPLGSDCPLFLSGGPVVMRGRGERVDPVPAAAAARLRGRRVLLFKPAAFGVATAWAYGRLASCAGASAAGAATGAYLPAAEAERRLAAWCEGRANAEELLFNNLEPVVFRKFVALPALLEQLRRQFSIAARMSGSGSACFALLPADAPMAAIIAAIREAWGAAAFVQPAAIA